jgi:uncharacterized protein (DUF433 family)
MSSSNALSKNQSPWVSRLSLPAYLVKDAARYAKIAPQTILNWQKDGPDSAAPISGRDNGKALSYLQLIEVAVVAAMRSAGISLAAIREAKTYIGKRLNSDYPFAEYGFKTDGTNILMDLSVFDKGESKDKLILVNKGGQLGWKPILDRRLKEFEYKGGIAVKWNLDSVVSIDPQIAFGAPSINGIPTWTIKNRLAAGESVNEIADDFSLKVADVRRALAFEKVNIAHITDIATWSH